MLLTRFRRASGVVIGLVSILQTIPKELGDKLNLVREEKEELRKRLGELDKDEAFILGELEDLKTAAQQDLANIHAAMGATALPSWDSDVYH